jgi:hypothetical protein
MPMLLFGKARIISVDLGEEHSRDVSVLNKNFHNEEKLYQYILLHINTYQYILKKF